MTQTDTRVIVVTGGSRGIGRAICQAFAEQNAVVYFNYASNHEAARDTIDRIAQTGGSAIGIPADISSQADVTALFDRILTETGRVDVLVNNAGITRDNLLVRMKESDWDQVMSVNLKGAFLCTKAASKTMIKRHFGRIINITSVVGAMGNAGQANYASAKAGIIGFTKSIARELASRNITVNAVAPGYIETDMTHSLGENVKESMIRQIPLGRFGTPEDVAQTVRFLASEHASYITGQVIHVSGGMYI